MYRDGDRGHIQERTRQKRADTTTHRLLHTSTNPHDERPAPRLAARLAALGRAEDIPSPSYTLVQTYDLDGVELWHADLYRLASPAEAAELGLEEAFATAITVVEWAERLGAALPARRLMLALELVPGADDARRARLSAEGPGWDWLPAVLAEAA